MEKSVISINPVQETQSNRVMVNVSDLSDYVYCPRKFYLRKILKIYKTRSYFALGSIEHEARRILNSTLKHQYAKINKTDDLDGLAETCSRIIEKTVEYVKNIALLVYPTYSLQIKEYISELQWRLIKEEETRIQEAYTLIERDIKGRSLTLRILPWGIEVPLVSERLGLRGRIDEIYLDGKFLIPVDIKTTTDAFVFKDSYKIQIAAYGLLTEDRFAKKVNLGKIYYTKTLNYAEVSLSTELRSKVIETKDFILDLYEDEIPPPLEGKESLKCNYCYLKQECSKCEVKYPDYSWAERLLKNPTSNESLKLFDGVKYNV